MTNLVVTIFEAFEEPRIVSLSEKDKIHYFGRDDSNDIVFKSKIVSGQHGRILYKNNRWIIEDKEAYREKGSKNGLIYNGYSIVSRVISDGDFFRIDDGIETKPSGVLLLFSYSEKGNTWKTVSFNEKYELSIGRDISCDIVIPFSSASKIHARIVKSDDGAYIVDNDSTNGILINGKRVLGKKELHEKDIITISSAKIIYTSRQIRYCLNEKGVSLVAENLVVERNGKKGNRIITCNHTSLAINPGELIGIVGGSGAGKSTVLNCMSGYLKPNKGNVFVNGIDLYKNYDDIKQSFGYVPQADIVFGNLSLKDSLFYSARLRLPKDTSKNEIENIVRKVIRIVELNGFEDKIISQMSGGQRKRASIAVELLSDPSLLFLDEPASGLDPGTERSLMQTLRSMADNGKTIVMITHSTLQLELCDKIIFLGRGGNLCYFGNINNAKEFFNINNIVDVYAILNEKSDVYKNKYDEFNSIDRRIIEEQKSEKTKQKKKYKSQLITLCERYLKLITNDFSKVISLAIQAPVLIFLISLVADGEQFKQYEITKSLFFVLACSGFWIGMLNAIQEICKEREIVKREFMTGLSLADYIISKFLILAIIGMIQSIILVCGFWFLIGLPEKGLVLQSGIEIFVTTFLTILASIAIGLFVSSVVKNADKAMIYVPILLMIQILFSGLIFKLEGIVESLSWFTTCRWSMEGYGTVANLNALELKLQTEGILIPHDAEYFFDYTKEHLIFSWLMLGCFAIGFTMLARISMEHLKREQA